MVTYSLLAQKSKVTKTGLHHIYFKNYILICDLTIIFMVKVRWCNLGLVIKLYKEDHTASMENSVLAFFIYKEGALSKQIRCLTLHICLCVVRFSLRKISPRLCELVILAKRLLSCQFHRQKDTKNHNKFGGHL